MRTYGHIAAMVEEARLPDRVRKRALATFQALATAEGRIHRRPPEQVHFHEVGALDAIVDIVGTASALEVLEVDELYASPVANGMGMTRCRARGATDPRTGGGRTLARRTDLWRRRSPRAHDADRRRAAGRERRRLGTDAVDGDRRHRVRRRHSRHRRPAQRRASRLGRSGERADVRAAGDAARGQRRRRHRRNAGAYRRRAARRRRARRMDRADRDEEGPARVHGRRALRSRARVRRSRTCCAARPARSAFAARRSSDGHRPAPPRRSRSPASRCG